MTQPHGQWQQPQQQLTQPNYYQPMPYQQQYPQYHVHYTPPVPVAPQNGMGTAALTLGIIGLFIMPFLGILAIVFGAIGISRADQRLATNRGAATAGVVLGVLEVAFLVIYLAVWM